MLVKSLIALLACVAQVHAFIGISIHTYEPACAYACRAVIAGAMLDCPASHADHLQARHGHDTEVTPFCRSHNEPFLSTLAYCINQTCVVDGVVKSDIEHFWENVATGGDVNDPLPPIWSWAQALDLVKSVPTEEYNSEEELEETALVPQNQYYDQFRTLQNFAAGEGRHTRYSLAILLVGFSIPILATLAYYLPFAHTIITKLKPYLIYPAKPVHLTICNLPNLGQTWYIVIFIILNIIFTAVGYHSIQPNMWYTSRYQEILSYVSARTGVIAMAEAPLVFLFAGRNNILLWLTNWDHSTYLLLHRWIARIFTLHVIIHSVGELAVYVDMDMYKENLVQPYWIWGCVATVACAVMCIKSIFRSYHYEIFIILHIILAVFILAGTWYHLIYRFDYQWGYHLWMYAVFAVWAFDRVLRALRIAKAGWLNATVTDLGGVITRVDIHGVRWDSQPGKHAYIYFPLVNKYTPWQSHPFSVIPTRLLQRHSVEHDEKAGDSSEASSSNHLPLSTVALPSTGVTFYVKGHSGLTRRLLNSCSHGSVRALVEGPYGNNTSNLLRCDRLVLISGGIGITATLPYTFAHINSKLYWSVRTPMTALVNDITPSLHPVCERDIKIGSRFDVGSVIEAEVASWGSGLIAVVVCGPVGMCDDVRKEVVRVSKATGAKIELKVEAFSW